jgi:hypothetical protein
MQWTLQQQLIISIFNDVFMAASKHPTFFESKKIAFRFIETFGLRKGVKHKGYDATFSSEAKQLHDRVYTS